MVCLWALFKRGFRPTRPDIILTSVTTLLSQNCINCIAFHPKRPPVFACGSYTGEVLLYDYSKAEEQLIAKTSVD
jgi:WD40 repeat protein